MLRRLGRGCQISLKPKRFALKSLRIAVGMTFALVVIGSLPEAGQGFRRAAQVGYSLPPSRASTTSERVPACRSGARGAFRAGRAAWGVLAK
jgi:hypothetical protein